MRTRDEGAHHAVAEVAKCIGWEKLWEAALDEGPRCVWELRGLVKVLCHQCFGDGSNCPCEHRQEVPEDLVNSLSSLNLENFWSR